MDSNEDCSRDTELRHLPISHNIQLSMILDLGNAWKTLMRNIPKNISDIHRADMKLGEMPRKYNNEHINIIYAESERRLSHEPTKTSSPTQILFDEWAISGRKPNRPTIYDLQQLLNRSGLFRAAAYVAVDILKEAKPERPIDIPRISAKYPICLDVTDDESEFSESQTESSETSQTESEETSSKPDLFKLIRKFALGSDEQSMPDVFSQFKHTRSPVMDKDNIKSMRDEAMPNSDILLTDGSVIPNLTSLMSIEDKSMNMPKNPTDSSDSNYIPKFTLSFGP